MKKICTLVLAVLCCFVLVLPAFAATETKTYTNQGVTYTLAFDNSFYDRGGVTNMVTVNSFTVTAQKGRAPDGSVEFKLKRSGFDAQCRTVKFSSGGLDTDCTQTYTYNFTIADRAGNASLTRARTSGHTADDRWVFNSDRTSHSCGCSHPVCTQKVTCDKTGSYVRNGNGTHTFTCSGGHIITENCSGGTATCTGKAVCQYCSAEYGNTDPDNHNFSEENKTDDTLKAAGDCLHEAVYYKTCSRCGAVSDLDANTFSGDKDEDNHVDTLGTEWQTDTDNTKHWLEYPCCHLHVNEAAHASTGNNAATCTSLPICDVCLKEYGAMLPHNYTRDLVTPEALASAANCTTPAVYYKTCSDCTAVSDQESDTFTYGAPLGHGDWGDDYTVITEPTCGVDGVAEGTCGRCHEPIADIVVPATGEHTWDAGAVTRKATTTAAGEMTYTCSVCGQTKTEPIAKLPSTGAKHAPQTGDESRLAVWAGVLIAACGAALVVTKRKKENG